MNITRRTFSAALTVTGLAAAAGISPFRLISPAFAQSPTAAEIAHPSSLGDMALGDAKAPVTIVEYASMTCPHCATFTKETFPKLKEAYIDTGKVRFIFREFPLNLPAAAGSMLARCIAKDDANKYFAVIDLLFKQQDEWAYKDTTATLERIAKQAGMGKQQFEACLKDQKLLDAIKETQDYAVDKLKVNSTPSFFVNETPVRGDTSFDAFKKIIDPLLKS